MIKVNSKIIINKSIDTIEIDDEKAMIDLNTGKYYTLNETGSCIWDIVVNNKGFNEIIDEIVNIYDVDRDECIECTSSFLNDLSKRGLVQID